MTVDFDFSEATAFSRALDKAASQGLEGDRLSLQQMKRQWKAVGNEIARAAAGSPDAPWSGLVGTSVWSKGQYRYEGKHGDLRRLTGYGTKAYRSGMGVRVAIGALGKSQSNRKKLAGLVGKFAVHNVRRTPGGRAQVGPRRDWLGAANRRTAPRQAKALVETYHRAKIEQVKKNMERTKAGGKMYVGGQAAGRVPSSPWG